MEIRKEPINTHNIEPIKPGNEEKKTNKIATNALKATPSNKVKQTPLSSLIDNIEKNPEGGADLQKLLQRLSPLLGR